MENESFTPLDKTDDRSGYPDLDSPPSPPRPIADQFALLEIPSAPVSATDDDIVDQPEELMEAEAKVIGRTRAELQAWLSQGFAEWIGPRGGWMVLLGAIVLWLWITYNR